MADDEVKCPLCKGHAVLTRAQALERLESADFHNTIQGYHQSKLNLPEDAGTEAECELAGVPSHARSLAPERELARNWLGWGRRSLKE
jgi:hypothetical protein